MKQIGVDIGGTFTDIYLIDDQADAVANHKVSTTADAPEQGALAGIREICDLTGTSPTDISYVFHGSTIATNALLERDGVTTGMITTSGYRDILHIGRHQRPQNYSIQQDIPWQTIPLVKRQHRKTVPERMSATGDILTPLDKDTVAEVAVELVDHGVEAIAIAFLYSYLNEKHEQTAKQIVRDRYPDVYVTTSSEVYPQFREFERFTTAAMNAYIAPTVIKYLSKFKDGLRAEEIDSELYIMQSNGGIATEQMIERNAVNMLYSGPAAGVLGGKWRGEANVDEGSESNIITMDVGGTSADISIVADNQIIEANVRETQIGGYPLMLPMIDIEAIGAGGGSIAHIDEGGAFRVGPDSAGAVPGPVCYDRGGTEPTVTDAQVALGRIRSEFFLGGELTLDKIGAMKTIQEQIASPLGVEVEEASLGILHIVNTHMANAIRSKTIQKGRDPQKFTLVAFGGAGPMHAVDVASTLGIPQVLIPQSPGVLSAVGLTTTDLQYDYITTSLTKLGDIDDAEFQEVYAPMISEARQKLRDDGLRDKEVHFELVAELRYIGQGYELKILVGFNDEIRPLEEVIDTFHQTHEMEFGHSFVDNPVEFVNARVTAYGTLPSSNVSEIDPVNTPVEELVLFRDEVFFLQDNKPQEFETPFFDRKTLGAGQLLEGPAIIGESGSTMVIPPDSMATIQNYGDILIQISE